MSAHVIGLFDRFPAAAPTLDDETMRRVRLAARQAGCINDEVTDVENYARHMMLRDPRATEHAVIEAARSYATQLVGKVRA